MNPWKSERWQRNIPADALGRCNRVFVFADHGVNAEVKRACREFVEWLKGRYVFPLPLRVYLREGLCGMIRGATITIINLIALSAMAGCVGGGGLGDYAIRYGFQRFQTDVTLVTVVVLLILVTLIQSVGNLLTSRLQQ